MSEREAEVVVRVEMRRGENFQSAWIMGFAFTAGAAAFVTICLAVRQLSHWLTA